MNHEVSERRLQVPIGDHRVPGLLWTASASDEPRPVVLICHGRGEDKGSPYVASLACRLVRNRG